MNTQSPWDNFEAFFNPNLWQGWRNDDRRASQDGRIGSTFTGSPFGEIEDTSRLFSDWTGSYPGHEGHVWADSKITTARGGQHKLPWLEQALGFPNRIELLGSSASIQDQFLAGLFRLYAVDDASKTVIGNWQFEVTYQDVLPIEWDTASTLYEMVPQVRVNPTVPLAAAEQHLIAADSWWTESKVVDSLVSFDLATLDDSPDEDQSVGFPVPQELTREEWELFSERSKDLPDWVKGLRKLHGKSN